MRDHSTSNTKVRSTSNTKVRSLVIILGTILGSKTSLGSIKVSMKVHSISIMKRLMWGCMRSCMPVIVPILGISTTTSKKRI